MDLKPFKLDIDELMHEFVESESTTLAEFRRVWVSRKFSFIFEASPSSNQGFFMQSLYANSIGHLVSSGSLSTRLGGLYCLYCLYETQPFKPPFKIYLSLAELRQLKALTIDAKTRGVNVVSTLLKSMLERNMFLFGSVGGPNDSSATKRVNKLTDIQNASVQAAYKKLFANSRLEHFIHMDLRRELDVDLLKKRSSDYALAKEFAIKGASRAMCVEDVRHIADNKRSIGEVVEKTAAEWNSQKKMLYGKTGIVHPDDDADYANASESGGNMDEEEDGDDGFGKELEVLLA